MRFVALEDIVDGDIIAKDVITLKGIPLVKAGVKADKKVIDKIRQNKIYSVYITDALTEKIIKDVGHIDRFFLHDIIDPYKRLEYMGKLKTAVDGILNVKQENRYSDEGSKLIKVVGYISRELITKFLSMKDIQIQVVDIKIMDVYDYAHALNVAILSIITGINLGLSEKELYYLSTASLLMNVGENTAEYEFLIKDSSLTEEEKEKIKRHTDRGRELLSKTSSIHAKVKEIILNHHERLDGSGYPRGLKARDICILTRIVMICDVYDAMTSDRVYRPAFLPDEVLEYLLGSNPSFDLEITKTFMRSVIIYPNGSFVQLSDGRLAIVINQSKDLPLRPVVKVLKGSNVYKDLDLKKNKNITIEKTVKKIRNI